MKKNYRLFFFGFIFLFVIVGCQKQEDSPPLSTEIKVATTTPSLEQTKTIISSPTNTVKPTQRPSNSLTELQVGSEGDDVLWIENQLYSLGYWEVGVGDGLFDVQTEAAVKHFQLRNNLNISGIVDIETRAVLEDEKAIRYYIPPPFPAKVATVNSSAPYNDDHVLQDRLASLGYIEPSTFSEWTSGTFGPKTKEALIAFQKDIGVAQTGIPDLKTWKTLFSPIPQWIKNDIGESVDPWKTALYTVDPNAVAMAWDGSKLWMAISKGPSYYENFLLRIDPNANPAEAVISIRPRDFFAENAEIANMVFANGKLWVLYPNDGQGNPTPLLQMIDPETGVAYAPFEFANCPEGFCFFASGMGAANGLVWVAASDQVYAIDTSSAKAIGSQTIGFLASGKMVFDGQCFWYLGESSVNAFSPKSGACRSRSAVYNLFVNYPETDGTLLWTANYDGGISQLNLDTGVAITLDPVVNSPSSMVYGNNILWIADEETRSVVGYSPALGNSGRMIDLNGDKHTLILQESNYLWIYNQSSGTLERVSIENYEITPIKRTATPVFTATPRPTATSTPTLTPTATMPAFSRTLKLTTPNMQGDDVLLLQNQLLELGYTELGAADGSFGKLTESGVVHLQRDEGLQVDEVVGTMTWEVLFKKR